LTRHSSENYQDREFPMSNRNFSLISDVAYHITGIKLGDHKKNMIYSRLARRIRALGLRSFDDYCSLIETESGPEITEFVNAITTNLTAFFREPHHFEFLANTVCANIRRQGGVRRLRGWSAGCSTGEEPYSISIVLRESMPATGWDIKLLATDLDSNVVAHSKAGIYNADRVEDISSPRQKKWFMHDRDGRQVKVKQSLQDLITFKQLNLLHTWPMKGPFDFIFCRNVVIYFDKETQKVLFDRYADLLKPNGYLFIGHSETLHKVSDRFRSLGKTMYQRIK
jgi:chemotaxis protein methyltransferase CheR